jgi:ribosomal protein S18 acetylase RimI-like enzyme
MITVTKLSEASEHGIQDINHLLTQLREDATEHAGSITDLKKIVADPNVALIVAKDDERVIGMATLYMITKFAKRTAHVEDVVVDSGYRGQGLGQKVMEVLIQTARDEGVKTVHLTSRPERVAGNKLYQKLGFQKKETNVYSLKL